MKALLDWSFAIYAIGLIEGAVLATTSPDSPWWFLAVLVLVMGTIAYAVGYSRQHREPTWDECSITVRCSAAGCDEAVTVSASGVSWAELERRTEQALWGMGWRGDPLVPFSDRAYHCFWHRLDPEPRPEPVDWFGTP